MKTIKVSAVEDREINATSLLTDGIYERHPQRSLPIYIDKNKLMIAYFLLKGVIKDNVNIMFKLTFI